MTDYTTSWKKEIAWLEKNHPNLVGSRYRKTLFSLTLMYLKIAFITKKKIVSLAVTEKKGYDCKSGTTGGGSNMYWMEENACSRGSICVIIFQLLSPKNIGNREEKSLRHVALVAKFLHDNKPKIHLKSKFALFQTSSVFSLQFLLICQMLAKFSGLNPKGPYLSLEKLPRTQKVRKACRSCWWLQARLWRLHYREIKLQNTGDANGKGWFSLATESKSES